MDPIYRLRECPRVADEATSSASCAMSPPASAPVPGSAGARCISIPSSAPTTWMSGRASSISPVPSAFHASCCPHSRPSGRVRQPRAGAHGRRRRTPPDRGQGRARGAVVQLGAALHPQHAIPAALPSVCGSPWSHALIDHRGALIVCDPLINRSDYSVGNVSETPFERSGMATASRPSVERTCSPGSAGASATGLPNAPGVTPIGMVTPSRRRTDGEGQREVSTAAALH
jgi:hypothetical protein